MDSNHRDIPIVEDDQGEGYKDPIEALENLSDKMQRATWAVLERLQEQKNKGDKGGKGNG